MAEGTQKKEDYIYGEWRKAINRAALPRDATAPPRAAPAVGSIHEDETAKKVGMRGAVVAGPTHLDLFQPVLLKVFGPKCFETGSISMFYTFALLHGEEARVVVKELPKGAKNVQVEAKIETPDGRDVAEGTVAMGNPKEKSYVHGLKLESSPPGELRILAHLKVGYEMPPRDSTVTSEELKKGLEFQEDKIDWNSGNSPWGGPIVPPSRATFLMMINTGTQAKAVGFFGATSLYYVNGPVKPDVNYQAKARVIAVGATSKTEYFWFDSELFEKSSGKQIAGMRMMTRYMKAGSPLYPEIK